MKKKKVSHILIWLLLIPTLIGMPQAIYADSELNYLLLPLMESTSDELVSSDPELTPDAGGVLWEEMVAAMSRIEGYVNLSDYRIEQQKEIQLIIKEVFDGISQANSSGDIRKIVSNTEKSLDAIKTDEQLKKRRTYYNTNENSRTNGRATEFRVKTNGDIVTARTETNDYSIRGESKSNGNTISRKTKTNDGST